MGERSMRKSARNCKRECSFKKVRKFVWRQILIQIWSADFFHINVQYECLGRISGNNISIKIIPVAISKAVSQIYICSWEIIGDHKPTETRPGGSPKNNMSLVSTPPKPNICRSTKTWCRLPTEVKKVIQMCTGFVTQWHAALRKYFRKTARNC
jgi:hypothetical protein